MIRYIPRPVIPPFRGWSLFAAGDHRTHGPHQLSVAVRRYVGAVPLVTGAIRSERRVGPKQAIDFLPVVDVDIAIHLHAIYGALNQSRTWGEFRRLLPAAEWPAIEQQLFLGEDEVEDEDRSHWEDDEAPFMVDRVRGIDENHYPCVGSEWLGDVGTFPDVLIAAHNKLLIASADRFILWQIPLECGETVASMLRQWGYFVERTDFLEFC